MTATPEPASREETAESFAERCFPSSNWPDGSAYHQVGGADRLDVWKSRRIAIAKMVKARDAIRDAAAEERGRLAGLEQAAKVADVWEPIGSMPADIAEKIKRIPAAKVEEFARLSAREAIASKIRSLGAGGSR